MHVNLTAVCVSRNPFCTGSTGASCGSECNHSAARTRSANLSGRHFEIDRTADAGTPDGRCISAPVATSCCVSETIE